MHTTEPNSQNAKNFGIEDAGEKAFVVRNRLVVMDTATGQCWMRNDKDKKWEDLGNPTKSK
jgi:hypothetical protein